MMQLIMKFIIIVVIVIIINNKCILNQHSNETMSSYVGQPSKVATANSVSNA